MDQNVLNHYNRVIGDFQQKLLGSIFHNIAIGLWGDGCLQRNTIVGRNHPCCGCRSVANSIKVAGLQTKPGVQLSDTGLVGDYEIKLGSHRQASAFDCNRYCSNSISTWDWWHCLKQAAKLRSFENKVNDWKRVRVKLKTGLRSCLQKGKLVQIAAGIWHCVHRM